MEQWKLKSRTRVEPSFSFITVRNFICGKMNPERWAEITRAFETPQLETVIPVPATEIRPCSIDAAVTDKLYDEKKSQTKKRSIQVEGLGIIVNQSGACESQSQTCGEPEMLTGRER